jgi:vesicle-associated membrane protein 7
MTSTDSYIFHTDIKTHEKYIARTGLAYMVSPDIMRHMDSLMESIDYSITTKKSYSVRTVTINIVVENGVGYLCVAHNTVPRRICFSFLERIKTQYSLQKSITKSDIRDEMVFFSTNPDADKIRKIQVDIDQVKDVMLENIEKILTRGENLEDLDRKTDDLRIQTLSFSKTSKALKCALCRQNIVLTIVITSIILFVILLFGGIIIWQISHSVKTKI